MVGSAGSADMIDTYFLILNYNDVMSASYQTSLKFTE
jgi:hypothetical protein